MAFTIDENKIYGKKDLAEKLDRHPISITRMVKRGELPKPRKIGRRNFWRGKDILASLATPAVPQEVRKKELERAKELQGRSEQDDQ